MLVVGRTLLPVKSTFVVNAKGQFAIHVTDTTEESLQQAECKLSTCDNSSYNWN